MYRKRDVLLICVMLDIDRAELLRALRKFRPDRRRKIYLALLIEAGSY